MTDENAFLDSQLAERLTHVNETLRRENDCLRAIAAKVMPCHYCHAQSLGQCVYGLPGCLLADDVKCYEDSMAKEIMRLRKINETLAQSLQQMVQLSERLQTRLNVALGQDDVDEYNEGYK